MDLKIKFLKRLNKINPDQNASSDGQKANDTSLLTGPVHPGRYPRHKNPLKGQVLGGECNVTRCDTDDARFWNRVTHGFYCSACAREINRGNDLLCIAVRKKPSLSEMEALSSARDRDTLRELHDSLKRGL